MSSKHIFFLLSWVALFPLLGQVNHGYFDRLTSDDGLSENHVNCIHQDDTGLMWFGTFDGLNRFDGYEVTTFKPDPNDKNSISGILIYALTGDRNGNIWIGTTGTGLNRFDPTDESFTTFRHNPERKGSLLSDAIQTVFVDRKNRLWVGTDRGLSTLNLNDLKSGEPATFRHLLTGGDDGRHQVNVIYEDDQDRIWIGTDQGLFRLVELANARNEVKQVAVSHFFQRPVINDIVQTKTGQLILGGREGLFVQVVERDEVSFTLTSNAGINNLAIDSLRGNLWVGTQSGITVYDPEGLGTAEERSVIFGSGATTPGNGLSNNTIDDIYVDRHGLVWVGTFGGGVNRFDPNRKEFRPLINASDPSNLTSNSIRAIYQTKDGRVWIGTVGGGLSVAETGLVPNEPNAFTEIPRPQRVYSILEVNNAAGHHLYLGTDIGPGLYRLDLSDRQFTGEPVLEMPFAVFAALEDSRGHLWFGTYSGGLYRWIPDPDSPDGYRRQHFTEGSGSDNLPSNIVRSILEDRRGNIWIGTGKGLVKLAAEAAGTESVAFEVFQNVPGDKNSLSHDYVLPLYEARDGTIWVGTFGGGLNRYIPADEGGPGRFEQITEKDGLPNGVIKSILEDADGKLWLASNKGITHYCPNKGTMTAFDNGDGLQSNEFQEMAALRQQDGLLVFGGVNGLDLFYPEDIEVNQISVEPTLTKLAIGNESVRPGEEVNGRVILQRPLGDTKTLELKPSENSISLQFAALQYATPEKNRYAYQLVGFDEDWIYTDADNRRATYTNLPYDDFTFRVKAANHDGIWSEEVTSLQISIQPPFYLAWYAYLLYGLVIIGLLYAFRRYSLIDAEEKNRLLIEEVSREKIRELNQLKLQFFTNISHEFRTPLTLITGPLESMLQAKGSISSLQRDNYHHLMYKNAKYLLRLVNQLLDFRKLDQGQMPLQVSKRDVVGFIREITSPFEFLATKKNIDFQLAVEEEPIALWFDPDVLEKVIYNLLANAFKFTPEKGRVVVTVRKDAAGDFGKQVSKYGSVVISVRDSGPGIPRKQLKYIFDRFYKSPGNKANNREGAGIGLAYTKSLLELHHGDIKVESKEGKGTTFYVRLALDKAHYAKEDFQSDVTAVYVPQSDPVDYVLPEDRYEPEAEGAAAVVPAPAARLITDDDSSPLLLYVDDNADLRNFIRTGMASDFRVIAADSGAAGLELARTSLPDIIISDVMMPGIDGMELLQELKKDPVTSHIPVIMLTAKDTVEAKTEGLEYGADGYVTKPFNLKLLRQQIVNIVQRREILRDRFRREVITTPKEVTVTNADEEFLKRAMDIVEENMSNTEFSVEQLVKEMRVSRSKLYLKLKALTGQSSSEFVRTVRLKRAVQLLENSGYSVKEVMFMTGFNTASYFSKCFRQQFGIVPSEYVKRRKAEAAKEKV